MIYVTANQCFGQRGLPHLRGFNSLQDMHSEMIIKWNATVTDQDTVVHLGNLITGNLTCEDAGVITDKLAGNILLAPGLREKREHLFKPMPRKYMVGFDSASAGMTVVHFSHLPPSDAEYNKALENPGPWLWVHGNTRGSMREFDKRVVDVCVESTGFFPVSLERLIRRAYT